MAVQPIVLLGDPRLYQVCEPVHQEEVSNLQSVIQDLHDTLLDFRKRYGAGRAIAAPQIGVMKRIIYMNIVRDDQEVSIAFLNPELEALSEERFAMWDDCMSFPHLMVHLYRHKSCKIKYRDMEWNQQIMDLEDDLSELLQHECDHLDGVLAISRAIDDRAFRYRTF